MSAMFSPARILGASRTEIDGTAYLSLPIRGRNYTVTLEAARRYKQALAVMGIDCRGLALNVDQVAELPKPRSWWNDLWVKDADAVFVALETGWRNDAHVVADLASAESHGRKLIYIRLDEADNVTLYDHEMMPLAVNEMEAA